MRTILICPAERPAVRLLSECAPLVNVPLLGQSLLEYWLAYLAAAGTKEVEIIASDREDKVQQLVGDGARWGLSVDVLHESRELTPAQALTRCPKQLRAPAAQNGVAVLDHFPGFSQFPLFGSYTEFFKGVRAWMPLAQTADRVGVRQLQPGVWVGLHSRIARSARLILPCWIGSHVWVGAQATIGPEVALEDGAFIEAHAELGHSHVGANTFVGKFARIHDSLAFADNLINWKCNSATKVPDPFLLCSLAPAGTGEKRGWLHRLADLWSAPPRQPAPGEALDALFHNQTRPI